MYPDGSYEGAIRKADHLKKKEVNIMLKKESKPRMLCKLSRKATAVAVSLSMLLTMAYHPITAAAVSPSWQDSGNVATGYEGGSGTADDPYQIATAGQLAYLAKKVNSSSVNTCAGLYFVQTENIDLSGKEWTPIGMLNISCMFCGNFNGEGYSITGLTINTNLSDYNYYGLFGDARNAEIENVNLSNLDITVSGNTDTWSIYIGGLAGNLSGSAKNCHISGTIDTRNSANLYVGGLVGHNSASVIGCSSSCTILSSQMASSGSQVGGIVGQNDDVIKNCFATGSITGDKSGVVGGIAGNNLSSSTIENSYTNCAVSTALYVGGIVGANAGSVTKCYAVGSVSDSTNSFLGGIAGNNGGTVLASYYNSGNAPHGQGNTGGSDPEVSMAASDMQTQSFVDTLNLNSGSGDYPWAMDSGTPQVNSGYPVLITQNIDAALSGLSVGTGSLSPAFSSAVTTYFETETAAVTSVSITPTVRDTGKATVTVNGAAVTSGSATRVAVTPGVENDIRVTVSAENNSITRTYLIKVKDGPDIDATLSGLTLSCGSLSPAFSAAATSYDATIPSGMGSITVSPTVHDTGRATVTVNGAPVASGSASSEISLISGAPVTISVAVTAEDGTTSKTYTIHATETPADATLDCLEVSSGTLSPQFRRLTTSYTLTMPSTATGVTVTPTAADDAASIKVNGTAVASGDASDTIGLTPGTATDITVAVKGSDGIVSNSYVLHVRWALPNWQDTENVATGYHGGDGSSGNPFQIATAGQLAYLAQQACAGTDYTNKYFVLTNDISLSAYQWTPIQEFGGTFDGAGHKITGLAIGTADSPDSSDMVGLFGTTGETSSIKDVNVEVIINSDSDDMVGSLIGASCGSVTGCSASGIVNMSGRNGGVGGLLGENDGNVVDCSAAVSVTGGIGSSAAGLIACSSGTVSGSYSTGNVVGGDDSIVGGLVGYNCGGIMNSWSSCNAQAGNNSRYCSVAGGLVGASDHTTSVTNCYATGNVRACDVSNGYAAAGGLLGYVTDTSSITNCYATGNTTIGTTSPSASAGGLIGRNDSSDCTVSNCYWNINAEQTANGTAISQVNRLGVGVDAGPISGTVTGKSAAEMQTAAFAQLLTNNRTDTSVQKAWNCVSNLNKGYPLMNGVGYSITSDSALSALSVSSGVLSPSFSAADTSYSVSVTNNIATISITPVTHDSDATVTVNGVPVTSGQVSQGISLVAGQTKSIPVVVTATDGSKTTYTVNVTRASSSGSGVQITGTSAGGDSSGYTASVSAQQAASGGVTITFGGLTVKDTDSVLSRLIASNPGSSLRLTEAPTAYGLEINSLAGSNGIISAFDINLFSVSSSGVSTQLHELGGNITITLTLTAAQKAQITDPSTAKLYFYDPETKSLVDMHATFNMTAGTVTFTTSHLSTFVLKQGKVVNPKTGSESLPIIPLVIIGACSASGLIIITRRRKWKIKNTATSK